mgnify:CR=1 FL=1
MLLFVTFIVPDDEVTGAAKNEANNATQKAAPVAATPVVEEKIDFPM